jgi:hypothetical protein
MRAGGRWRRAGRATTGLGGDGAEADHTLATKEHGTALERRSCAMISDELEEEIK